MPLFAMLSVFEQCPCASILTNATCAWHYLQAAYPDAASIHTYMRIIIIGMRDIACHCAVTIRTPFGLITPTYCMLERTKLTDKDTRRRTERTHKCVHQRGQLITPPQNSKSLWHSALVICTIDGGDGDGGGGDDGSSSTTSGRSDDAKANASVVHDRCEPPRLGSVARRARVLRVSAAACTLSLYGS